MLLHAASARRRRRPRRATRFVETFVDRVLETAERSRRPTSGADGRVARSSLRGAQLLLRAALLYLTASGAAAWATALAARWRRCPARRRARPDRLHRRRQRRRLFPRRAPCRTRRPPSGRASSARSGTRRPSRWCSSRRRRRAGRRPLARRRRVRARVRQLRRGAGRRRARRRRGRRRARRALPRASAGTSCSAAAPRVALAVPAAGWEEAMLGFVMNGTAAEDDLSPTRRIVAARDVAAAAARVPLPGLETRAELGSLGTIRANATSSGWLLIDGVYFELPCSASTRRSSCWRRLVDACPRPEPSRGRRARGPGGCGGRRRSSSSHVVRRPLP